jgi:hypothetical protein
MTSGVSIVSDFVANSHQISPNDSCSPSKIPYGGFSPVRLQTGFQSGPSPRTKKVKCMSHIPPFPPGLYLTKVRASAPISRSLPGKVSGVCPPGPSRPEALGSPGSYVVSPDPRLLWPHPKLSAPPPGLLASSRRVFVLRSGRTGAERLPTFLRMSFSPCRRTYPGRPGGCSRLFLHHLHWPSPPLYILGICNFHGSGSPMERVSRLQRSLYAAAR